VLLSFNAMPSNPPDSETSTTGTITEFARLAPASIIRTETVLSKMPIHNLAKKGTINIQILRKNTDGQVELSWRVSPSRDYGEPRQLAYKIDTLIVNRHIDEKGRPLPPMIALGSIRQICRDLGINEGKGSNDVKRSILQNSSAFISAKLTYKGNDGIIRRLAANFTRYSVIFTGEKLPDGRTADGVYLILNDPYREVLNNAPVRPLNYDYLRKLPPTQQRFYEIVSYRIFAGLKYCQDEAKMAYSEYCTYSAQERYFDRARVQKQMYKVHRPHMASGYLKSVRYQETTDTEGKPDWFMYYVPGPKARAEYHAFSNAGRLPETLIEAGNGPKGDFPRRMGTARRRSSGPRQQNLRFNALAEPKNAIANPVLSEMTKRGISLSRAHSLIISASPEVLLDQLEWGDHLIARSRGSIINPPGFLINLIIEKVMPPEDFETSRRRKARELAQAARDRADQLLYAREEAYHNYRSAEIDRHIRTHVRPEDMERLIAGKIREHGKENWRRALPPETLHEIAEREVRLAIAKQIRLLTFEEFSCTYRQGGEEEAVASSFPATLV
jgi:hypothetical protein